MTLRRPSVALVPAAPLCAAIGPVRREPTTHVGALFKAGH